MKRLLIAIPLMIFSPMLRAEDFPATLQWSQRVELSTPVSGVVKTVDVEAGDLVRKGQVLLSLDDTVFKARVAETRAEITRLEAEVDLDQHDLDRVQGLYERTVVSTTDLEQAKLKLTTSRSTLDEARARLQESRKMLEDSSLRAPFDAVVILRQAQPGLSVAAGLQPQVLLTVARSGQMVARMNLPSSKLEKLKIGQPVSVNTGSVNYSGKVKTMALEPVMLNNDWYYPVDVVFSVKEILRSGTPAKVIIP